MKSEIFLKKKYGSVKIVVDLKGTQEQQAKAMRNLQDDVWTELDEMAKTAEERIEIELEDQER